jgi:hypothetical protein
MDDSLYHRDFTDRFMVSKKLVSCHAYLLEQEFICQKFLT